jgi:multiple sugar transport system ATP-binding protein
MLMTQVAVRQIVKNFGDISVLKGVSLDVAEGEFLTLLGPSGCGKSTLLRIVAGLEAQDEGHIEIGGKSADLLRPKQRDVAMVFQSYALYPHMTVGENLSLPLQMRRMKLAHRLPLIGYFVPGRKHLQQEIGEKVQSVAKALEIEPLLGRKPGQLSGGQRQRVAVGRAMVRAPAVFLMDEPLSNLDAKLRVQMRAEITDLHRRLGITFIYVTHDQAEAMTMSTRVAVMLDGELLQVAPPATIYADPEDQRVAEFVGSPRINIIEGTVRHDGAIDLAGAVLQMPVPFPQESRVTVGIRPEAVSVSRPDDEKSQGPVRLEGRIQLIENLGADLFVHVTGIAGAETVIARAAPKTHGDLETGAPVHITFAPENALAFGPSGRRLRAVERHAPALVNA